MITPPQFNSQFAPEQMMTMFNFRSVIITAFHYLHILCSLYIYGCKLQKFSSGNLHVHVTFFKRFKEQRLPFRNRLEINPPAPLCNGPRLVCTNADVMEKVCYVNFVRLIIVAHVH